VIPNFLDNHDVARYFDSNPGAAKSSNAIVGNFLISGIPIIYYGTEREMKGNGDPSIGRTYGQTADIPLQELPSV